LDGLRADRSVGCEAFDDLRLDPVPEQAFDVGQQWLLVDAHQRNGAPSVPARPVRPMRCT
jgi:hypothetical protein